MFSWAAEDAPGRPLPPVGLAFPLRPIWRIVGSALSRSAPTNGGAEQDYTNYPVLRGVAPHSTAG